MHGCTKYMAIASQHVSGNDDHSKQHGYSKQMATVCLLCLLGRDDLDVLRHLPLRSLGLDHLRRRLRREGLVRVSVGARVRGGIRARARVRVRVGPRVGVGARVGVWVGARVRVRV